MATENEKALLLHLQNTGTERRSLDRIVLSHYQIAFMIEDIELCAYISATLRLKDSNQAIVLQADWRQRDPAAFRICSAIGRIVEQIRLTDVGVEIELEDFGVISLQKADGMESFYVHAPRAGGTFIY